MDILSQVQQQSLLTYTWLIRIAERMTISLVVVLVALLLTALMWKQAQKIDLAILREEGEFRSSVTFAMPVFLLLAIILFSYVSFSHPISVDFGSTNVQEQQTANVDGNDGESRATVVGVPSGQVTLVGYSPADDETLKVVLALNALIEVERQLQASLIEGGEISSIGDQISRISRITRALFSHGFKLTDSGFPREKITECRAAIAGGAQLDSTCLLYQQMTRDSLQ